MFFDKFDFPCALPFFQTFFAMNGIFSIIMNFVIHQLGQIIAAGKSFNDLILMLPNPSWQIRCNAYI